MLVRLTAAQLEPADVLAADIARRRAAGAVSQARAWPDGYGTDRDGRNVWSLRCEVAVAEVTGGRWLSTAAASYDGDVELPSGRRVEVRSTDRHPAVLRVRRRDPVRSTPMPYVLVVFDRRNPDVYDVAGWAYDVDVRVDHYRRAGYDGWPDCWAMPRRYLESVYLLR